MKITKDRVKLQIYDYTCCVLGALLVAAGIYFFKFPNNFSTGGVSGISIILSNYFHISNASTVNSIINISLLAVGFIFCGRDFGIKAIVGTLVFSGAIYLLGVLFPMNGPLTDEPLLELFFAMGIPAFGSALLFNCNGSTGGTEIIAIIIKKRAGINIGMALLFCDAVITAGAFLFGLKTGLYSVLGLVIKSLVVDGVIENINLCKCFSIITDHPQEISDYITHTTDRSTTILEATGGYSHGKKWLVLVALPRFQAVSLRRFIKTNYPETFMMITNSSEIVGRGFRGQ